MSKPLEDYKELLRQLDAHQRAGNEDPKDLDPIYDAMDAPWYAMTADERAEVAEYSHSLYQQWTPAEIYADAARIVESFPKPHENNVMPASVHEERLGYWVKIRDEAKAKMEAGAS